MPEVAQMRDEWGVTLIHQRIRRLDGIECIDARIRFGIWTGYIDAFFQEINLRWR
jgi:hypothetical protein